MHCAFENRFSNTDIIMCAIRFAKPLCVFFVLVWAVLTDCQAFPHPGCQSHTNFSMERDLMERLSDTPGLVFLSCGQDSLDIPADFNATELPASVVILEITCPAENYCNILRENCEPLPGSVNLVKVILRHFRTGNETQRPPVDRFLQENKRNIQALVISNSKLYYLDKEFMRGFDHLIKLELSNCSIRSLELNTFEVLMPPDRRFNYLTYLYMDNNHIDEFDWAVLIPLRSNLKLLDLSSQKNGLHLSSSNPRFRMQALRQVRMKNNGLKTIPNEVLGTLFLSTLGGYWHEFGGNIFCSNSDCSCCHLKDFMEWAASLPETETNKESTIRFDCAERSYQKVNFTLDIYQNCTNKDN